MAQQTFQFYIKKDFFSLLKNLAAGVLSGKNPDGSDFILQTSEGGSVTLETPTGDVDGVNDEFVFSAPPIVVFRNGVNETRLGSIVGSVFTFNIPPSAENGGDDIEGLV